MFEAELFDFYKKTCLNYNFKVWRYFEPKIDAPFTIREHAGHTSKVSFENTIAFDTRDRPLIPTRGVLSRIITEYAGLVGDSAFLKNQVDFQVIFYVKKISV